MFTDKHQGARLRSMDRSPNRLWLQVRTGNHLKKRFVYGCLVTDSRKLEGLGSVKNIEQKQEPAGPSARSRHVSNTFLVCIERAKRRAEIILKK